MAMAGNAVGLGNFLRFPGKAAPYGGAFMVPYFLTLILLGVPLMWIEWTIGRHGGGYGHGSTPGMFHRLWKHPASKYLGIFGVLLPAIIGIYYVYIESWALGYAWDTAVGAYWGQTTRGEMGDVFGRYLGLGGGFFSSSAKSYLFFLITFAINIFVFARGIEKGIEVVAKYAMPTLTVLGIILALRVLTLHPIDDRSVGDGLARIWVIDWSVLSDSTVWITAAGQIFFSLSLGFGMIHSYASVLRKDEDITLNGLATCSMNEFVEVVIGGTIVIPAAAVFFGVGEFQEIISKGSFADLGFQTLPVIFQKMFAGRFFGTLWFILLFLAGLTSSMAMFTPFLLFLRDEMNLDHRKAVAAIAITVFILMQPVVLFFHRGVLDELDYWAGTVCLTLFATIEVVVFAWIFGMKKGWTEMHLGAELQVPRVFYYIMLTVTPVFAIALLGWWCYDGLWDALMMTKADPANRPYLWLARGIMLAVAAFLVWGVWHAWRTHPKFFEDTEEEKTA